MLPRYPSCKRAGATTPAGAARCIGRLPSRTAGGLPLISGESAPATPLFEACSAFTRVPARLLAKPPNGGPFTPECFSLHRYLRKPLWLLPTEATRVGWDSHPLGLRAFPWRTEKHRL